MIEFRQKEFANINKLTTPLNDDELTTAVPKQFIKAIEMYDLEGGKHIKHWLLDMVVKEIFVKGTGFGFYPQQFLATGGEDNDELLIDVFGKNEVLKFRNKYKSSADLIAKVKIEILSGKRRRASEPKYEAVFKKRGYKFNYSDEDYSIMIKFLSLCISGQVPEADWDRFWEVGDKYCKILDVNYKTAHNLSESYLCRVIAKVFRGITGSNILADYE